MTEEREAMAMACIQRALDDAWQDGRRRARLKRAIEDRVGSMRRVTGYQTLDALRSGDRELYFRFLAGCERAMVRDGLIEAGLLGTDELRRLQHDYETRDLHDAFDDMDDASAERYGE